MNLYVVTGTTQGLGLALAEAIAAGAGNQLVTLARKPATTLGRAMQLLVDVADEAALDDACDRLATYVASAPWSKAVLINNAGIVAPVSTLARADAAALRRNVAVNFTAPLVLMARFLAMTSAVPLRRVINISSGAGRRPISGWGAYCATKAALDMASRVAALETGDPARVQVVSLAPGVFDTGMQAQVRGASPEDFADVERFRAMKAEGALRAPADVAADILRLEAEGRLGSEPLQDLRELL